jgi:hypothetical protein
MENLITNFTDYLLNLGLITSKSDVFIIKRRYALMEKQCKQKYIEFDSTEKGTLKCFAHCSKSILADFFEERADEVVIGMLDNWMTKNDVNTVESQRKMDAKLVQLSRTFKRTHDYHHAKHAFDTWKQQFGLDNRTKYEQGYTQEKERRMIAEASLSALQVELHESLARISTLEKKENKRKERKLKRKNKTRHDNMNMETSRSITIEESPVKDTSQFIIDVHNTSDQLVEIDHKDKLEQVQEKQRMRRSAFPPDQRGSVNTEMRHKRLQNRLLTGRGSLAASSVYSQARTEFSFHPSINQSSKWKPKYDDHHNHKKMWSRMHNENEKIKSKNRLMSHQREQEELSHCTFTPEIFTKPKGSKNELKKHTPQDVKQLSLRLYQYADLFKEKRDQMKTKIDNERGEEMRFTPKLTSTKSSKALKTVRERTPAKDITLLSVKKPGSLLKKKPGYYDHLSSHSARKNHSKTGKIKSSIKTFSTSIYSLGGKSDTDGN